MGTLTLPPLRDDQDVPITGRTGITVSVFPLDTVTATPTFAGTGYAQEANGTVIVDEPAIVQGSWYHVGGFEPTSSAPDAYRGGFILQATGVADTRELEDGTSIRVLEDGTTERILEG